MIFVAIVREKPHCVRSIRLERRNKYFFVWTSSSVNKSILWNDTLFKDEVCPHLRLNSVGNTHRQDVESLIELGFPEIRSILTRSVKNVHLTPEQFRKTKDNVKYVYLHILLVFAVEHYPTEVEFLRKGLSDPIALSFLYIAECILNKN